MRGRDHFDVSQRGRKLCLADPSRVDRGRPGAGPRISDCEQGWSPGTRDATHDDPGTDCYDFAMNSSERALRYRQVDVFTNEPFSGNGLAVFVSARDLPTRLMLRIAQELRQFETIFVAPTRDPATYSARVFTMEEELDFAGHPVVGAACVLHEQNAADRLSAQWNIQLPTGSISVQTRRTSTGFAADMHQGSPDFIGVVPQEGENVFLAALGLDEADRDTSLPVEVISTGLPYLILPVRTGALSSAKVRDGGFEALLASVGAKFVYVFDAHKREGRTWDNLGSVEDVATGSAAGPTAAFLVRHRLASVGERIIIRQGRFLDRNSEMMLEVRGAVEAIEDIVLSGNVVVVGSGEFDEAAVARWLLRA